MVSSLLLEDLTIGVILNLYKQLVKQAARKTRFLTEWGMEMR